MPLTKSHYTNQHRYRVEWEPPAEDGSGGYVRWFVDGQFTYGIEASVLNLTQTQIPSEPMYLIMNTAISGTWGFPPCPLGCNCKCLECGNPGCICGLPQGFCQNFPAHMEIDYVRVYQAYNSSKQNLGCSTKERPTKRFIEAHKTRYKTSSQAEPLLPIQQGGASCRVQFDCGGPGKGTCVGGSCQCNVGYTGPTCRAPNGYYNDVPPPEKLPGTFVLDKDNLRIHSHIAPCYSFIHNDPTWTSYYHRCPDL